jgi:iron complex outermembrane receptor protein
LWFSALFCLHGHAATPPTRDLADLSLEELANIEVTSVSKSAEPLADAPASIFVITNDDIRRAGVRTLAEALRLAPNLQVARTSANSYAISARGFNNSIGNKLLVLIDGRTVYTPLFSGVFWDQQDVMLEDVERIEVISGPGATLWGANAVNGVINVITRSSRDTQGALAAVGAGNLDQGVALRYGGKLGEDGTVRIYGKGRDLQNTKRADGSAVPDGWDNGQVGFRADWNGSRRSFTVQGDAYRGRSEDRPLGGPIEVSGANLLARWNERFSSGSDIRLQAYYDRSERQDRIGFQGDVDTFDIDFQHGIPLGRHKLLWGAGYRRAHDNVPDTIPTPFVIRFVPSSRTLDWQNVFAQDEIRLTDSLDFTVGLKLESNDYTGWETLPSARLAWKPSRNRLVWGAVSRAVRAPARLDRDFFLVFPPLNFSFINGGPNFVSEIANVYEIGYRAQPSPALSYSITGFHTRYDRLRSGMPAPAVIENRIEGFSNGVEAWATFQATRTWRLSGGLSTLHQHLGLEQGSRDPTGPIALGNDPDHQWMLRSSWNIASNQELDVIARRVGSVPLQAPAPPVPAYTAVDLRWGWKVSREVELSLTLQNLFDPEHPEFNAAPGRSEFERGAFLKLLWRQH